MAKPENNADREAVITRVLRPLGTGPLPLKQAKQAAKLPNSRDSGGRRVEARVAIDVASLVLMGNRKESAMSGRDFLDPGPCPAIDGVRIGELVGLNADDASALVVYPGQPAGAALVARTVADLRGVHIGRQVVLIFEAGDPLRPIIIGCLLGCETWPFDDKPEQVEVDVDGRRLVLTAKDEMVLRCGKASITLTRDGYVRIRGINISSSASGTHRIIGGSVQIN